MQELKLNKAKIIEVINHFAIDISEDHLLIIPSLLWSLMCLDALDNSFLVKKCLSIVSEAHSQ